MRPAAMLMNSYPSGAAYPAILELGNPVIPASENMRMSRTPAVFEANSPCRPYRAGKGVSRTMSMSVENS